MSEARLAVLASGRGSNLAALLEAFPGQVQVVVSNREDAPALERARQAGVAARYLPWTREAGGRAAFEAQLQDLLGELRVELVLLAGFMRLLSADLTDAWRGRILNIHPSLLPAFPGLHAHRQALEAGVASAGCTVHFVDAGCDTGETILQKQVEVRPGDTEDTLAGRLLPAEHEAYPQAVRLVLRGLAFARPTPGELLKEFGVQAEAGVAQLRTARLLRDWGQEQAALAALRGEDTPLVRLARDTDELRLGWARVEPLAQRLARWEDRGGLLARADTLGLRGRVQAALALTADEWARTRY